MSFDHITGVGDTPAEREADLMVRVRDAMTTGLVPAEWEKDEQGYAYACRLVPQGAGAISPLTRTMVRGTM